MNPKDMNKEELIKSHADARAFAENSDYDLARNGALRVSEDCAAELLRRLTEADALRKENAKLRYALAMLLPLKQDGSVSICQMQRQFHLGYFAASTIAEAVNASTARHAKGGQP